MEPTSAPSSRWSAPARRRLGALLAVSLFVIAADQASKAIIRATLHPGETWPEGWELIRISHVHNTGAAFGILEGASTFLVIAPLAAIAAITVFLLTLPAASRWYSVALAAILGGAIGNLVDRIRLGHVTDFIDPTHYPSFNIADSAIVVGVITIAALSFLAPDDGAPAHDDPDDEDSADRSRVEAEVRS